MVKAFVSYARSDRSDARRVVDFLRSSGDSVWFDEDDLLPGQDWEYAIYRAIASCDVAIVLVSPESLKSRWVAREWDVAIRRGGERILPALIGGATFSELPQQLGRLQGIDLGHDYENSLQRLHDSIRRFSKSRAPSIRDSVDIDRIAADISRRVVDELRPAMNIPPFLECNGGGDDEKLVFVISSFEPDMEPAYQAIRAAAAAHGLQAKRVMDIEGDYRITDTMLSMIARARFIVADVTHAPPNVYFELGYARALRKRNVITIRQAGTALHFNIRDWPCITYTDSRPLEQSLIERFGQELSEDT